MFTNTSNIWSVGIPAHGTVTLADARPVTEGAQAIEGIALSPDGGSLVYDSDRGGNQDIYRMPLGGGDPVRLTSSPDDEFVTGWSADGRELALHVYQGGSRVVRVMSAEGGPERPVAKDPPNQRSAGFAPDGRRLVFTGEADGGRRLFVVARNAEGSWGAARRAHEQGQLGWSLVARRPEHRLLRSGRALGHGARRVGGPSAGGGGFGWPHPSWRSGARTAGRSSTRRSTRPADPASGPSPPRAARRVS